MEAPFKSLAVANQFVGVANESDNLTLMKLLKLIYFAHGWHLAITGNSLIDERIEAWQFGPVVPSIYHSFKEYGSNPITEPGQEFEGNDLQSFKLVTPKLEPSPFVDAFMAKIWEIYGHLTAFQLSEMTHQPGTPWYKTWYEMGGANRKGTDIPDNLILDYFKGKLAASNERPA